MDDYGHDEYQWLDEEEGNKANAESHVAENNALRSLQWNPERDGLAAAPSRGWLIRWFLFFPNWQGYELSAAGGSGEIGWMVRRYRKGAAWVARYPSVEAALAAIESRAVELRLEFEFDSADRSVHAWQGGAPGLGRGGRGRRR